MDGFRAIIQLPIEAAVVGYVLYSVRSLDSLVWRYFAVLAVFAVVAIRILVLLIQSGRRD